MRTKKIILGTVQMGLPYGINNTQGKITPDESQKILKKAFVSGIRLLDTAESYRNAHQIIGDFHLLNPEIRFNVITKIPPTDKIKHVENKVEQYLNALNVHQLECLMFHSYKSYKNNRDIIPRLEALKKNGLINQLGVSIYTNDELKELIEDDKIDLIQLPFNLLDNFSIRGKLLEKAKSKAKTIHTRSAFLQGLFFKNPHDKNPIVKALKHQMIEINKLSKDEGVSISTLALVYCIQQSYIDNVLIGVDSINQLQSNLKATGYQISKEVIQLINQIKTKNINLLNPSLWKEFKINN